MSETSLGKTRTRFVILTIQDSYNINLLDWEKSSVRRNYRELSDSQVLDLVMKIRFNKIGKENAINARCPL